MTNPVEILYSVPAILCAFACVGVTELVKRSIDARFGDDVRRSSRRLSVVLWVTPIVVGAMFALVVPLRPQALNAYLVDVDPNGVRLSLASWGAACGQFSSYIYDKAREFFVVKK